MYSNKMFAWLAAGAIGLGSSAALAQYQPEDEDALDVQQQQQVEQQQDVQQLRDQITQTLQQSYQEHGLDEQQARQQAEQIAGEVEQYTRDVQQRIQQTLQEHAQLDEQQAQQESERISQEIAQHLTDVGVQQPAEVDAPQLHEEQQFTEDEAQQQQIQGTIIDAATFLVHGEEAIQEQQEQQQQQQPLVLITDEGEAYLIVERPTEEMEPGLQAPLEEPAQFEDEQLQDEQFEQQEREVEPRTGIRSPVRDRLAPRADFGVRHGIAQREQERAWERHPGEWIDAEPAEQQEMMLDEPEEVEPAEAQQPSRVYQQLEVGQQVTLTGEVHERGGLRGIVIDEYGIERNE